MYYIFGHTINIFMLKINATRKIPYTNLVNNFNATNLMGLLWLLSKNHALLSKKY